MAKRISQLTALTSASLDTTLLGIDRGVSYKIELDVLADAVKDRINTLDDIRLDSLEAFTASYTTTSIPNGTISGSSQLTSSFDERYTLSGSVQSIILPTDLISSSAQIAGLGFITGVVDIDNYVSTSSYNSDSASFNTRIIAATNEQSFTGLISGSSQITAFGFISSSTDLSYINTFTQSIDSRVDSLESWSSSLTTTFATDLEVSIVSSSVAATIGIVSQAIGLATTGSNTFTDNQTVNGRVSASYFDGDARYLDNFSATTNWNYNQEFTIRKTEQLTFSGDYILEDTYLVIEGSATASVDGIDEWNTINFNGDITGIVTPISNNGYLIEGAVGEGGGYGVQIQRLFDTETTMSIGYTWNGEDVGVDRPYYDVSIYEPTEPNFESRLRDTNAVSESGNWTIAVPSGSWVAIGIWTNNANGNSGSLQLTFPYSDTTDIEQYSTNKYFKKEGSIFIGGNLLVKDSTIVNNGKISVGGEVILIGNSEITGTGTII